METRTKHDVADTEAPRAAARERTGVVIPVYLPADGDAAQRAAVVGATVRGFLHEVDDPGSICLAVDGPGPGVDAAQELAEQHGVATVLCPVNGGKLTALRGGMQRLMANADLCYFAAVDQDGDHFANELPAFLRAAQHVEACAGTDKVLVLGRRISRHRPMGFVRGELEDLADRVLLDALHYRAATAGQPLRLQFASTLDEFPDFHSGYKLFTRATAQAVFGAAPQLCGASEDAYYRHGCEAVMTVEALEAGAWLSVVNRSTYDEQPMSMFGMLNRQQLVADKMVWPCRRLNVPPAFAAQWLDNHLPRILLATLVPDGRDELLGIRKLVMDGLGAPAGAGGDEIARMPFL